MEMARGQCGDCGWMVDIVAVPMTLTRAAEAMSRASCCMCGSRKIMCAASRALTDHEAIHKQRLVDERRAAESLPW